jgi:hypothetical protein
MHPSSLILKSRNCNRFHQENDLGMDGAESALQATAGRDIESPLRGVGLVLGY